MSKGPKGEKRPADAIGAAVKVARIATGEVEDRPDKKQAKNIAAELGQLGGLARAKKLSKKKRTEIARKAASVRWAARSK